MIFNDEKSRGFEVIEDKTIQLKGPKNVKQIVESILNNISQISALLFFALAMWCLFANGMAANDNANFWLLLTLISMSLNNITKGTI